MILFCLFLCMFEVFHNIKINLKIALLKLGHNPNEYHMVMINRSGRKCSIISALT